MCSISGGGAGGQLRGVATIAGEVCGGAAPAWGGGGWETEGEAVGSV